MKSAFDAAGLHPVVAGALRARGWTPNREVDIDVFVSQMSRCGLPLGKRGREVLRNLGGLGVEERIIFSPSVIIKVGGADLSNWVLNSVCFSLGYLVSVIGALDHDIILFVDENNDAAYTWDMLSNNVIIWDSLETILNSRFSPLSPSCYSHASSIEVVSTDDEVVWNSGQLCEFGLPQR